MGNTTKTHRKMTVKKMNRKGALTMSWTKLTCLIPNNTNNKTANRIKKTKLKTKSSPTNKLYLDKRTNRMARTINNRMGINIQIRTKVKNKNKISLMHPPFRLSKTMKGRNNQSSPTNSQRPPDKTLKRKSKSILYSDYFVSFLLLFYFFHFQSTYQIKSYLKKSLKSIRILRFIGCYSIHAI